MFVVCRPTQSPATKPVTTTSEKLRNLASELAGEAWNYERRRLAAQGHVRRQAARALMTQADNIQHEDEMFEDPPMGGD